jgi:hypothetical protein
VISKFKSRICIYVNCLALNSPQDASGWNNHFHVIEKHSNENFELRKSGIAELKLMPLKERLTRFAALAVRESRPDPFCTEKKQTDAILLSGKDGPPREIFDRQANPYYDAEVDEDIRIIQRNHDIALEKKRKELARKRHNADLKTIPKCTYHPDLSVINMHQMTDEEAAMKKSENESSTEFRSVGDLYNTFSPPKNEESKKPKKKKSSSRKKGTATEEKLRFFASNYLGEDLDADSFITNKSKSSKQQSNLKFNIDKVFDHVMQPFDEYLRDGDEVQEYEQEERKESVVEEPKDEEEEYRKLMEEEDVTEPQGTDITSMLQEQEELGVKTGFKENEYDYNEMGNDVVGDDLHYNEDEVAGTVVQNDEMRGEEDYNDEDGPIHTAEELENDENNGVLHDVSHVKGAEMLEESEVDVGTSHSVIQADDMFQSSFVNQTHHNAITKPDEGNTDSVQVDDETAQVEGQQSQSVIQPDDEMFQSSFVNQEHHGLRKDDDEGDVNDNEEGDALDNPHIEEQQQYVEGEDDEYVQEEADMGDDENEVQQQEYDIDGDENRPEDIPVYEDQENYDDGNLDFANEELDEDGMFTENQY